MLTVAAEAAWLATIPAEQAGAAKAAFAQALWVETRELALAHGRATTFLAQQLF